MKSQLHGVRFAARGALMMTGLAIVMLSGAGAAHAGGTFLNVTSNGQANGLAMLLTDGSVMVQDLSSTNQFKNWWRLTPDASGSYLTGSWSQLASSATGRKFGPSFVLKDGTVWVGGGEYINGAGSSTTAEDHTTVETFNPNNADGTPGTGAWIPRPGTPANILGGTNGSPTGIGDTGAAMLPDGRLLVSGFTTVGGPTSFYNLDNTWSDGPRMPNSGRGDEEGWQLLPDGGLINPFNLSAASTYAEKYIFAPSPGIGSWISVAAPSSIQLQNGHSEIGATVLLPDGRVWLIGGGNQTAFYTPGLKPTDPGTFAQGPNLPPGESGGDCPAAMLPNGHVLLVTTTGDPGTPGQPGPTLFREFDPSNTNWTPGGSCTITSQTCGPFELLNASVGGQNNWDVRFLNLPSGDILVTYLGGVPLIYRPTITQPTNPNWKPRIYSIQPGWAQTPAVNDGSFILTGSQLNGISLGTTYGDDAMMATNYPIVRITDASSGNVYYARTYSHSTMGVRTGNPLVSTWFKLPAGMPSSTGGGFPFYLSVIANGIASDEVEFQPAQAGVDTPFFTAAQPVPGRFEAENFDNDGTFIAHPSTTNVYRISDANIVACNDTGGGYEVDGLGAGDWLQYRANGRLDSVRTATFRVASAVTGASFHILEGFSGQSTAPITVPNTGGAHTWQTITVPFTLPTNEMYQRLVLVVDTAGFNINWMSFGATAPTGVTAAPSGQGVTLSWDLEPGVNTFNIYRSTSPGGEGTTVYGTTTTNTFTDTSITNGTKYYYKVAAIASDNLPSTQSAEVSATPNGPAAPTGLALAPMDGVLELSWNAVTGADFYSVFRSTTPNGEGSTPVAVNLSSTLFIDQNLVNGTTYYYKVNAVSSTGTSPQSSEISGKPVAPPPPPTGLTATPGPGAGQISLRWNAVPGATSYKVNQGAFPGEPDTQFDSDTPTTFVDSGLTAGTTYYFSVFGINASGNGQPGNEISAVAPGAAPNAPTGLTATTGLAKVTLSWTASAGAASYKVYRGTATNQEALLSTPVITATSYVDTTVTPTTKYYYKVTALGASGAESAMSTEKNATPAAAPTPTGLTATAGAGKVTLGWATSSGATGYNLYRGTATGQESTTALNGGTPITATTYVDSTVTAGTKYFYVVAALPAAPTPTKSTEVNATPTAGGPPSPPTTLTATAGVAQVSLSWTASTGATSYKLYRSTSAGNETLLTTPTITGTTYVDTSALAGTKYYYKATAVAGGVESTTKSSEVNATPTSSPGIKINGGGPAQSPFVADVDFDTGNGITHTNNITLTGVTNPAPAAVYTTAHNSATGFTYTIPGFVPGSSHTVRLHFCETYFTKAAQRQFDVTLQGTKVLPAFDIWVQAGNLQNQAVVKQFTATANASGAFVIQFTKVINSAWVSGIEIL